MEASGTTVLVVDDDSDVALLCRLHLETAGYQVLVASDGQGGLDAVQDGRPDAVVLDYMLPDMDGLSILGRLRGDPRTADIPVVMVTARADVRDQQAAWEAGVSDYITKPFDRDRLLGSLAEALAPEAHVSRARRQREALADQRLERSHRAPTSERQPFALHVRSDERDQETELRPG